MLRLTPVVPVAADHGRDLYHIEPTPVDKSPNPEFIPKILIRVGIVRWFPLVWAHADYRKLKIKVR